MTKRSDAGRLAVDGQELPGPDGLQAALDAAAEVGERAAVWLDGRSG
ncbi:hypothetical protein J5Y04_16970 [Kitasatospora sp. RG8]|nr:hypothetical protein [Kitasatospora sp. RG8]MBP0451220.1 hypothetical protein [Kitasatospora sp. RG8]